MSSCEDYLNFDSFASFFADDTAKIIRLPQRVIDFISWLEYTEKASFFDVMCVYGIDNVESPIEMLFDIALKLCFIEYSTETKMFFKTQHEIVTNNKKYRADFLLSEKCAKQSMNEFDVNRNYGLIIEVDGHNFHEKTKEQVAYNNQRDMDLKMLGYDIIHFSGSQIYNDPYKCAKETISYYEQQMGKKYARNK